MSKLGLLGLSAFCMSILAQVAPTADVPALPNLDLSSLTATGLLGLYALYVTVRTIPKMDENHRADVQRAWDRVDSLTGKMIENNVKLTTVLEQVAEKIDIKVVK